MFKNKRQSKRQQLECHSAMQARLTYLREEIYGSHWTCRTTVTPIAHGKKYIALRTADGIQYLCVGR